MPWHICGSGYSRAYSRPMLLSSSGLDGSLRSHVAYMYSIWLIYTLCTTDITYTTYITYITYMTHITYITCMAYGIRTQGSMGR